MGITNAVAVCKAKDSFYLIECNVLLNFYNVLVEFWAQPAKEGRWDREKDSQNQQRLSGQDCALVSKKWELRG